MLNRHAQTKIRTAAALGIFLFAAGCSKNEAPEAESVAPVQTAPVVRAPMQRIIKAQAILHPLNQASITPKIAAPVREFHVNRGDHVRQGQLLAVLENQDLAAAVVESKGLVDQAEAGYRSTTAATLPVEIARAQAEVRSTKEALDAAQKLYDSRKELVQQGALPRRQLDEANVALVQARNQHENAVRQLNSLDQVERETATRQVQAQLDAAKGRHQGVQAQLEYSRITSPINGVVTERPFYAGEMAGTDKPLLTVMDISRVIARANVPADLLPFLRVGNPATIVGSDPTAELHGKVTVVSPALDPNSTTAEVWIEAPNPEERFRPGSTVQVTIVAETVPDAIVVPLTAILPSPEGGSMVLVAGADSLAHERQIEIGIRAAGTVQILKGLEPGEQVIVVGGLGLEDKAKVRIEKPEEKTGKGSDEKKDEKTDKK
jgi:HlyD family secretion protein